MRTAHLAASPTLTILGALAVLLVAPAAGQQAFVSADPSLYSGMRWRLIGPHRGGRVTAVAGIPGDPSSYYMGTPGGGVWKTTDAGEVWFPIFDEEHVASIGAIAVAPSNTNIVYVATGEQTPGNGVYRSIDAGATWTNVGLREVPYITSMVVDPRDPNIAIVGAITRPLATAGTDGGIYKTTDGGKTWKKTLHRDDRSGVSDLCADPGNPRVMYSALGRPPDPFANEGPAKSPDSWIYESLDEGTTWTELASTGLPEGPKGRIGVAVAPGRSGQRVFAIMNQGLFRSDDAGASWRQITKDPRIMGSGYFSRIFVDPRNADAIYVMHTSAYRSSDGGQTFVAFKGAPGGDDYHNMWIDSQNSQRMIMGVDQGAIISVDGGKSWTSWYNQPTGQFYHVSTDNQFPYIAYAAQQDSGTAAVPSRSDYGAITYRDWFSIGGFEFSYIAPDPLNPNIVYSGGWYGSVVRFDRNTGQFTHVFVPGNKYRTAQMPPVLFSPQDPHRLYLGTQYVLSSDDEGRSWQTRSSDLTVRAEKPEQRQNSQNLSPRDTSPLASRREDHHQPAHRDEISSGHAYLRFDDEESDSNGEQNPRRPTAISTLALSPSYAGIIWAGTTNGLIHITQDEGQSWRNVSPPELNAQSAVVMLEASHYGAGVAFATVQVRRDPSPQIFRTRDFGRTWQRITTGLPPTWVARVIREDPVRKGLLYAGIENGVYVSWDDGDHWQSLELNLPTSDARDLAVHDSDLVVATYGRALWVLDDLSPLRQASAEMSASGAVLLRPAKAVRVRWSNDLETPLPPEVPSGQNPPDGAIIYYFLKSAPSAGIKLEIHDSQGNLVRRFSSATPQPDAVIKNVPDYWFGPPIQLPRNPGLNRFAWDLRYDPPPALQYSYYGNQLDYLEYTLSFHAIPGETPREQVLGPLVPPGSYEVVLSVDGQILRQPLTVVGDPRIHISQADYLAQFAAAKRIDSGLRSSFAAFQPVARLRTAVAERQKAIEAMLKTNAQAEEAADALKNAEDRLREIIEGSKSEPGIGTANRDLARMAFMVESGDAAPSETALESINSSCNALTKAIASWRELNAQSISSANSVLERYKLAPLPVAADSSSAGDSCTVW